MGVTFYTCPLCGATYPHDAGYAHATRECPKRLKDRGDD